MAHEIRHEGTPLGITLDRRKLLKVGIGGIGATAATAAGLYGIAQMSGGERSQSASSTSSMPEAPVIIDKTITPAQAIANLNKLTQSADLYKDRPWADPHQLLGLSQKELAAIAGVPINEDTSTDIGFATAFAQKLELYFNAGQTVPDIWKARDTYHYPVGERDHLGANLGNYDQYVDQAYGQTMLSSLLMEEYDGIDSSKVNDEIKNYQAFLARKFEYRLSDTSTADGTEGTADTTAFVQYDSVEPLKALGADRRLAVNLTLLSPIPGESPARRDITLVTRLYSLYRSQYGILLEEYKRNAA